MALTNSEGRLNNDECDGVYFPDLYRKGYELIMSEKYEDALLELERAMRILPKEPPYLNLMVEVQKARNCCFRALGNTTEMLNDMKKAVDLDPTCDKLLFWRGYAYFLNCDYENAITDWELIIKQRSCLSDEAREHILYARLWKFFHVKGRLLEPLRIGMVKLLEWAYHPKDE